MCSTSDQRKRFNAEAIKAHQRNKQVQVEAMNYILVGGSNTPPRPVYKAIYVNIMRPDFKDTDIPDGKDRTDKYDASVGNFIMKLQSDPSLVQSTPGGVYIKSKSQNRFYNIDIRPFDSILVPSRPEGAFIQGSVRQVVQEIANNKRTLPLEGLFVYSNSQDKFYHVKFVEASPGHLITPPPSTPKAAAAQAPTPPKKEFTNNNLDFAALLPKYDVSKKNEQELVKIGGTDKYIQDAFNNFRGMNTRVMNFKSPVARSVTNLDTKRIGFTLQFFKELFINISSHNYPGENLNIPRPNHGILNHMRSIVLGCKFMTVCMQGMSKQLLLQIFPNINFLTLLVLTTPVANSMRRDEHSSTAHLTELKDEYFERLYPLIWEHLQKTNTSNSFFKHIKMGQANPHQIASSVLHKVVMKKFFANIAGIDPLHSELVSRALTFYYYDPKIRNNLGIPTYLKREPKTFPDPLPLSAKFFVWYAFSIAGHYMDHCRANYSKMLNEQPFPTLFDLLNISEKQRNKLANFTVNLIRKTQVNKAQHDIDNAKWDQMESSCSYNIPTCGYNNSDMDENKCKLAFDLQKVQNNNKPSLYSKVYKHIGMKKAIKEVFKTYQEKLNSKS